MVNDGRAVVAVLGHIQLMTNTQSEAGGDNRVEKKEILAEPESKGLASKSEVINLL